MIPRPAAGYPGAMPGYTPPQPGAYPAMPGPGPAAMHPPLPHPSAAQQQIHVPQGPTKKRPSELVPEGLKAYKKKRPTDRSLPSTVNALESVKESSKMYDDLVKMEKKLDWTTARKRTEIQDAIQRPTKTKRTLRIYISNTASGQAWQSADAPDAAAVDFDTGKGIPSWTMRVEGRLLDNNTTKSNRGPPRKFSSFLRSLVVEFDRDPTVYTDGNIVEWHRTPQQAPQDGFEIKRRGDSSVKARVVLHLEHQPERYRLAPELGALLDLKEESKQGVVSAMWAYIKKHNLQDKDDRRVVKADQALLPIFGRESIYFSSVPEVINRYLLPPSPVVLEYMIRVDKPHHTAPYVYDVEIDIDDPTKARSVAALASFNPSADAAREIAALDEEIAQATSSVRNAVAKRDFLAEFADDPARFVQKWLASQARDLDTVLGNEVAGTTAEEMRRAEFFRRDWVNEAVIIAESRMLAERKAKLSQGR